MMKISFQGAPGAYSHQICAENFPDADYVPAQSFEGALGAVREKQADFAMLPVENSSWGRVADVHHLLPEAGLSIVAEYFLRVHINWYCHEDAEEAEIKRAISHPMALGQCRQFLLNRGIEWQNWADTASAAQHVQGAEDKTLSALASPLAGEIYGLKTLASHVEDRADNTTRFLLLSREETRAEQGEDVLTSFVFDVRNIPAALYKALGGFATNGVNMTKLESYMLGGRFSATQFYADIEGHPDDRPVKLALDELAFFTEKITILGVYKASPFRRERKS